MIFYRRCKKYIVIAAIFVTFNTSYTIIAESKPNAYEITLGNKVIAYISEDENSLHKVRTITSEINKRFGETKLRDGFIINKVKVPEDYITDTNNIEKTVLQNSKIDLECYAMVANGKEIGVVANQAEGKQVLETIKNYYISKINIKIKESRLKTNITYKRKKILVNEADSVEEVAKRVITANSKSKTPIVAFELKGLTESKDNIKPATTIKVTNTLPEGQSKVESEGQEGEKLVVKEITIQNDQVVNSKAVSEKVITPSKNKVVLQGNKRAEASISTFFTTPSRGDISSVFGPRWGKVHEGIDIAANMGEPVCAALDGTVTYAGWASGYGNFIKLKHANGVETAYGHCSKINVNIGQSIKKGQKIGEVGNTGNSTGPHLHFEVRVNGVPVNPMKYLK